MEETITCPVCGETNPAELVLCQNCQWPLRSAKEPGSPEPAASQSETASEQDSTAGASVLDWLHDLGSNAPQSAPPEREASDRMQGVVAPNAADEMLAALASERESGNEAVPEWVARIAGTTAATPEPGSDVPGAGAEPRQDQALPAGEGTGPTPELTTLAQAPVPDDSYASDDDRTPQQSGAAGRDQLYEWLRRLDASSPAGGSDTPSPKAEANVNAPEDATGERSVPAEPAAADTAVPAEVIPDWLAENSIGSGELALTSSDETPGASQAGEPAGADTLANAAADAPGPTHEMEAPESDSTAAVPALAPGALSSIDVDAVVASLQTPDWLSEAIPRAAVSDEGLPPAAHEQEPIAPAELPSWVQAMRPVESILQAAPDLGVDEPPVERGPLLGLHGVLPVIPGAGMPSSKPQVRAMRLEVTEQQRARAALLEGILLGETKPMPLRSAALLGSRRSLRWAISAILLVMLGGALASRSQLFPLPIGVPNETLNAIQTVEKIPTDARVLVVFDYEPATVGEMEASAASLFDHLLLLRHPVLAMISTSPTGSVLAERFMANTLGPRAYQPGVGYVNLGYLPGGLAGVRAFSEDPRQTVPLSADASLAWDSPALQGVTRLSDFAAILVLSDGLESGRVWIEQTASDRGQVPMILVSSAQAGPMLLPYAASGQVAGLVAGLSGAAGTEMANGGLPGFVRRYWDAYSLGMYLAAFLIVLGGAWYAWTEIRARSWSMGT